jgi:hypothetical protein
MTFTIVQTRTTPQAEFRDGYLLIKGKSVPFDHPDMYDIIKDRLTVYAKNPESETKIDFNLSAVNAVSKRSIVDTFRLLDEIDGSGTRIQVNWFYQSDDEDVMEFGEICQSNFKVHINLCKTV